MAQRRCTRAVLPLFALFALLALCAPGAQAQSTTTIGSTLLNSFNAYTSAVGLTAATAFEQRVCKPLPSLPLP
jgi:hypothetical protein